LGATRHAVCGSLESLANKYVCGKPAGMATRTDVDQRSRVLALVMSSSSAVE